MRIQQLRYLEKIATTGSINEAAKQLFISNLSHKPMVMTLN